MQPPPRCRMPLVRPADERQPRGADLRLARQPKPGSDISLRRHLQPGPTAASQERIGPKAGTARGAGRSAHEPHRHGGLTRGGDIPPRSGRHQNAPFREDSPFPACRALSCRTQEDARLTFASRAESYARRDMRSVGRGRLQRVQRSNKNFTILNTISVFRYIGANPELLARRQDASRRLNPMRAAFPSVMRVIGSQRRQKHAERPNSRWEAEHSRPPTQSAQTICVRTMHLRPSPPRSPSCTRARG